MHETRCRADRALQAGSLRPLPVASRLAGQLTRWNDLVDRNDPIPHDLS